MDQELSIKLQQLAGCVSDSSTGEEEVDGVKDSGSDVQMDVKRQGSEDRDEGDERLWRMEIDLDEGRTEDEEEEKEVDDEEMKDRLYRLVAQARLTYLTSTDDELDKVGLSEGEWEGDKDEDEEEGNKEQKDEKIDGLPYKICQLEKEVGASQFSSTEDELDRVGVMEEEKKTGEDEEDGKNEELAVKVCRLANQVNATQFSSTEDELDGAGRGEEGEEAMDEEALWKLQAEKAVQVAQLRDLSCLVSASQFSPTEDRLDGVDGENEGVNEGGFEGSIWEEEEEEVAVGKNWERRESFGDLDVKMFDLREEIEERQNEISDENLLESQTKDAQQDKETEVKEKKDCVEVRVTEETEGERMVKGHVWEEKVQVLKEAEKAKETEEGQEMEAEDLIALHETKVQQENQPEAKWPDKREGEETAADSDEEDEEFDRIISSMLMMTLEDMQGGILNEEAAENGKMNREPEEVETDVKIGRERGFEDHSVDAQSTNASEETGSVKESQSRGENVIPESAVKERPGESVTEQVGGHIGRKNERGDAADRNQNEKKEKDTDPQDKRNLAKEEALVMTIEETLEAKQTRMEAGDDKREDGRGKVTTEWQMMETCGDAAEGGCKSKETDERLEETKEETPDGAEQSSTSLQEGLLSPEETQIVSIGSVHPNVSQLEMSFQPHARQ